MDRARLRATSIVPTITFLSLFSVAHYFSLVIGADPPPPSTRPILPAVFAVSSRNTVV
jgi:hypothetical protein